jgi:hypothetical protein
MLRDTRQPIRVCDLVCAAAFVSALALPSAAVRAATIGDCNGDGSVTIAELVMGVGIALGSIPLQQCGAFDANADGVVSIDELVRAVAAALSGPVSTPTLPSPTPSPSPTPFAQVLSFGAVGGQPCGTTQLSFKIPDGLDFTVSALRIDFCVDATAFQVSGITCSTFSASVAIDQVTLNASCSLEDPINPSGEVRVDAHGTGGDSGTVFQPFDEIDCTIPVFPTTAGGNYPVRYRVAATTSRGSLVNSGDGTITVFGLDPTGRFQGECCTSDTQCSSGFCRGGDSTRYNACCESDCPTGVCNAQDFAGTCCASAGLPGVCNAP